MNALDNKCVQYVLGYCSLLLLLCERKLTTFSKDVFSWSKLTSANIILSYQLNVGAVTYTDYFVLSVWIHPT